MSILGESAGARQHSQAVGLRIGVADSDSVPWLTWMSGFGLAAAALFAVFGGLPFDLPMPTHRVGVVTPTCGLTRGSTAVIRGDFDLAWRYNPASFLVIGGGVLTLARGMAGSISRRWVTVGLPHSRIVWTLLGVAIIGFWLHQQTNADFVITSRR